MLFNFWKMEYVLRFRDLYILASWVQKTHDVAVNFSIHSIWMQKWHQAKPWSKLLLKIGTANSICWNYLGLFTDYGLGHMFFWNKTFF